MTTHSQTAARQLGSKRAPGISPRSAAWACPACTGAPTRRESIATIHAALERGVTLLDTGDFYGMGHNEMLIGRALAGRRDKVLLSVKFGALRAPDGGWLGFDARPAAVKNFLGLQPHAPRRRVTSTSTGPARLDPAVPIEETIGAIADLVKAGYVRHIGLSEVGADDDPPRARRASDRRSADRVLAASAAGPRRRSSRCSRELGIGVTAYGVLSRGLLSGSKPAASGDFRAHLPRFTGENRERNQQLVDALREPRGREGRHRVAARDRLGAGARARASSR